MTEMTQPPAKRQSLGSLPDELTRLKEWRTSIDAKTVPSCISEFVDSITDRTGYFDLPLAFHDQCTTQDGEGEDTNVRWVELVMQCSQHMPAFSTHFPQGDEVVVPPSQGFIQVTLPWRTQTKFYACVVCYKETHIHSAVQCLGSLQKTNPRAFGSAAAVLESILVSNRLDMVLHVKCGMHAASVVPKHSFGRDAEAADRDMFELVDWFAKESKTMFDGLKHSLSNLVPTKTYFEALDQTMKSVVEQQAKILDELKSIKTQLGMRR